MNFVLNLFLGLRFVTVFQGYFLVILCLLLISDRLFMMNLVI